ncbi:MAG: hypothetical protein ACTHMG_00220 [Sphingomonas sp.]
MAIALIVLSCTVAFAFGRWEGKWIATFYVAAIVATHYARVIRPSWVSPNLPVAVVDVLLLVALYGVAINSRRYWPIWMTAFHVLTVAAHAQAWIVPAFPHKWYFVMESFWAIPKLLVLLIGVILDWEHERPGARRRGAGRSKGTHQNSGR